VRGATVRATDPAATAARWAHVLGAPLAAGGTALELEDGGVVRFVATTGERPEAIAGFDVDVQAAPAGGRAHADLGGVRFTLRGPAGAAHRPAPGPVA
jgi:hypothetical protein